MNSDTKQIANQRIHILLQQAEATHKEHPQLARRYVEIARKVAMGARIRLPTTYRQSICRKCNTLLVPGANCRVRIQPRREPHLVITCLICRHQRRISLRKRGDAKVE